MIEHYLGNLSVWSLRLRWRIVDWLWQRERETERERDREREREMDKDLRLTRGKQVVWWRMKIHWFIIAFQGSSLLSCVKEKRQHFICGSWFGVAEGDLLRFVPFSAILCYLVLARTDSFHFALICCEVFQLVFRTNQNTSGKPLSAEHFCQSNVL